MAHATTCLLRRLALFRVDMSEYTGGYGSVTNGPSTDGAALAPHDRRRRRHDLRIGRGFAGGTTEYKFTLDGWTSQEEFTDGDPCTPNLDGYINRTIEVSGNLLPPACWNSCG